MRLYRIHVILRHCMPLLLLTVTTLNAAEYFVSPQGNDEQSGSRSQPWRTIQKAASTLSPGDTALILEGAYDEKVNVSVSGNKADGYITIKASGKVKVTGKKAEGRDIFCIEDQSYVRLQGFEICEMKANDGSGIRVLGSGSNIELIDNTIHDIRGKDAMAITVYGTHATRSISDLLIQGNMIYDCEPAKSEALTLNGNVERFRILNNVVRDVNNIGICMIGGEEWINPDRSKVTRNGLCKGNKVSRAKSNYGGGYAAGIYVDGGKDITVEDNEVTGCDLGIEVGAENAGTIASGVIVQNNRLWLNEKAGLVIGGYDQTVGRVKGCKLTRNYCYQNDQHEDKNGELWIQWAEDNEITQNVFWAGEEALMAQVHTGGVKNRIDANTYFSEVGSDDALFIWKEKDVNGFQAYQTKSQMDAHSRFVRPKTDGRIPGL